MTLQSFCISVRTEQFDRFEPFPVAADAGYRIVGVDVGIAASGEVFGGRDKAAVHKAFDGGGGVLSDDFGVVAVGADVDFGVHGVDVEIQHGRVDVGNAHRAELQGDGFAGLVGNLRVAG